MLIKLLNNNKKEKKVKNRTKIIARYTFMYRNFYILLNIH